MVEEDSRAVSNLRGASHARASSRPSHSCAALARGALTLISLEPVSGATYLCPTSVCVVFVCVELTAGRRCSCFLRFAADRVSFSVLRSQVWTAGIWHLALAIRNPPLQGHRAAGSYCARCALSCVRDSAERGDDTRHSRTIRSNSPTVGRCQACPMLGYQLPWMSERCPLLLSCRPVSVCCVSCALRPQLAMIANNYPCLTIRW